MTEDVQTYQPQIGDTTDTFKNHDEFVKIMHANFVLLLDLKKLNIYILLKSKIPKHCRENGSKKNIIMFSSWLF